MTAFGTRTLTTYSGWRKSCTSWDPHYFVIVIVGISAILGGLRLLKADKGGDLRWVVWGLVQQPMIIQFSRS